MAPVSESSLVYEYENDGGIMLGCWDYDKTTPLIKQLEHTVNVAEKKCGDLMQQLNYYKLFCSSKWNQTGKNGKKRSKRTHKKAHCSNSSSDDVDESQNRAKVVPEIDAKLFKKINKKIAEVNDEITQANRKMGLNDMAFILPQKEGSKTHKLEGTANSIDIDEDMGIGNLSDSNFDKKKSVLISEDEYKLFKRLSSKSLPHQQTTSKSKQPLKQKYRLRSSGAPQGIERKFGFGTFFTVPTEGDTVGETGQTTKPFRSKEKVARTKARAATFKTKRGWPRSARSSYERKSKVMVDADVQSDETKRNKSESSLAVSRVVLQPNISGPREQGRKWNVKSIPPYKSVEEVPEVPKPVVKRPAPIDLCDLDKKPIPFTTCTSTSKSFNIGMNIQQVLSMVKHKPPTLALQGLLTDNVRMGQIIVSGTGRVAKGILSTRDDQKSDSMSIATVRSNRLQCTLLHRSQSVRSEPDTDFPEGLGPQRPEDVWVVEPETARSRCTCYPTKRCVDYHKVLKQYTGEVPPRELFPIASQESVKSFSRPGTACGDFSTTEVAKRQAELFNLNKRYVVLQDQLAKTGPDYTLMAELEAMDSDLVAKEEELRHLLAVYNEMVALKERTRELRRCSANKMTARQTRRARKNFSLTPTHSMALTQILRQIQGLQDRIKLVDVC